MNLDDDIRSTLRTRAEEAPAPVGLLDGVRIRVRRRQHRRRIGAAGLVAAVGVGVAATTSLAFGLGGAGPTLAAGGGPTAAVSHPPPPTPTQTALRSPDRRSTVALVSATVPPVRFDLTPQWTPPGLPAPVVGHNEEGDNLVYEADGANLVVLLTRQPQPPDWTPKATQSTTVGGRPATLTTGIDSNNQPVVRLTWRLADRRYVDVQATALTREQIQRYADNLVARPFTRPLPFSLALAPAGYQVSFQEVHPQEFHYCVSPPGKSSVTEAWVCVGRNPSFERPSSTEAVRVGSDPGELSVSDGAVVLLVHRPGFEFIVTENSHGPLSNADVIRFAAGVGRG